MVDSHLQPSPPSELSTPLTALSSALLATTLAWPATLTRSWFSLKIPLLL
jgi:hypothetical protein